MRILLSRKAVFIAFLVVVLYWLLVPTSVLPGPMILKRNKDGEMKPTPESHVPSELAQMYLGWSDSGTQLSMGSYRKPNTHISTYDAERIMMIGGSEHPLLDRIGVELMEHVKTWPIVEQASYYPRGSVPEPGTTGTTLYLYLDLASVSTSFTGDVQATIRFSGGRTLFTDPQAKEDRPFLHNRWGFRGHLAHTSRQNGVYIGSSEYRVPAKHMAGKLAKKLKTNLTDVRNERPHMEVPDLMFPPFTTAPDFAFLKRLNAEQVVSTRAPGLRNETCWIVRGVENQENTFRRLRKALEKNGWKPRYRAVDKQEVPGMKMCQGERCVEVFSRPVPRLGHVKFRNEKPDVNPFFVIRYTHALPKQGQYTMISSLMKNNRPLSDVLFFIQKTTSDEQVRQFLHRFEEVRSMNPHVCNEAANFYLRMNRKKNAREAARRAKALARCTRDRDLRNAIEHTLERAHDESFARKPLSVQELKAAGFSKISSQNVPVEKTVSPHQRARFFLRGPKQHTTYCFQAKEDVHVREQPIYRINIVKRSNNGNRQGDFFSLSSKNKTHTWNGDKSFGFRFRFELKTSPDPDQVSISAQNDTE